VPSTSRAPEGRGRAITSLTSHSNGGRAATVSSITTATARQRRAAETCDRRVPHQPSAVVDGGEHAEHDGDCNREG
jgi:hypothetical protein